MEFIKKRLIKTKLCILNSFTKRIMPYSALKAAKQPYYYFLINENFIYLYDN